MSTKGPKPPGPPPLPPKPKKTKKEGEPKEITKKTQKVAEDQFHKKLPPLPPKKRSRAGAITTPPSTKTTKASINALRTAINELIAEVNTLRVKLPPTEKTRVPMKRIIENVKLSSRLDAVVQELAKPPISLDTASRDRVTKTIIKAIETELVNYYMLTAKHGISPPPLELKELLSDAFINNLSTLFNRIEELRDSKALIMVFLKPLFQKL